MTSNGQRTGFTAAALGMLAACVLPLSSEPAANLFTRPTLLAAIIAVAILFAVAGLLVPCWSLATGLAGVVLGCVAALALLREVAIAGNAAWGVWLPVLATWLAAGICVAMLAAIKPGKKAAARAFHICETGHDAEFEDPFKRAKPSERTMTVRSAIPGAIAPARNAFAVSQALSWLAGNRGDIQEQLEWRQQIPGIAELIFGSGTDGLLLASMFAAVTAWAPEAIAGTVYLMVPPLSNAAEARTAAPLSVWGTMGTYDTAAECRKAIRRGLESADVGAVAKRMAAKASARERRLFQKFVLVWDTGTPAERAQFLADLQREHPAVYEQVNVLLIMTIAQREYQAAQCVASDDPRLTRTPFGAGQAPAALAVIPFTPGKPIYVDARINGTGNVRLLLDTGADGTIIAPRVLRAAGWAPRKGSATLRGVTGHATAVDAYEIAVGKKS